MSDKKRRWRSRKSWDDQVTTTLLGRRSYATCPQQHGRQSFQNSTPTVEEETTIKQDRELTVFAATVKGVVCVYIEIEGNSCVNPFCGSPIKVPYKAVLNVFYLSISSVASVARSWSDFQPLLRILVHVLEVRLPIDLHRLLPQGSVNAIPALQMSWDLIAPTYPGGNSISWAAPLRTMPRTSPNSITVLPGRHSKSMFHYICRRFGIKKFLRVRWRAQPK